ncbi:hypothetical protein Lepto7375DRAFT_6448 [Leptolyngbya sp. PCC 7375]|nr:hypothetical protein Lepto7375DRAFT_6448 [Leptolyngbya sp. PCC 7375]
MDIAQGTNITTQRHKNLLQQFLLLLLISSVFLFSCSAVPKNATTITSDLTSEVCLGMSLEDVETYLGRPGQLTEEETDETEDAATYLFTQPPEKLAYHQYPAGLPGVSLHRHRAMCDLPLA